ncbi:hypothetical protein MTO96_015492 [Rhipicephalus appendiculatus]
MGRVPGQPKLRKEGRKPPAPERGDVGTRKRGPRDAGRARGIQHVGRRRGRMQRRAASGRRRRCRGSERGYMLTEAVGQGPEDGDETGAPHGRTRRGLLIRTGAPGRRTGRTTAATTYAGSFLPTPRLVCSTPAAHSTLRPPLLRGLYRRALRREAQPSLELEENTQTPESGDGFDIPGLLFKLAPQLDVYGYTLRVGKKQRALTRLPESRWGAGRV